MEWVKYRLQTNNPENRMILTLTYEDGSEEVLDSAAGPDTLLRIMEFLQEREAEKRHPRSP